MITFNPPETLVNIEQEALMDCSELVLVHLHLALKAIPKDTFAECEKLAEDTVINDNVKVSMDAFKARRSTRRMSPSWAPSVKPTGPRELSLLSPTRRLMWIPTVRS